MKRTDYPALAVDAAKSVLIELIHLLGEYRDQIVVVGGWVPMLLLEDPPEQHVGTLDVDLALNHLSLTESGYETIAKALLSRGYEQDEQQPFTYRRRFCFDEQEVVVKVDLLAGEYGGSGRSRRTQKVQDVRPRKARGCELAFELNTEVTLKGQLPEGGEDTVQVRVASAVPFIVMKGMALNDRLKEKDAWDIYYMLKNYPGGLEALAAEFEPYVSENLVREGLDKIGAKFSTVNDVGPKFVADFEGVREKEERELLQRDAYERVQFLLNRLEGDADGG